MAVLYNTAQLASYLLTCRGNTETQYVAADELNADMILLFSSIIPAIVIVVGLVVN